MSVQCDMWDKADDGASNDNQISWLSGVPAGVRLLSVVSNLYVEMHVA